MKTYTTSHSYQVLTEDMRPQDETLDGSELTFKTMEHGGEYPDTMPGCIEITDKEGRSLRYVPIEMNGKPVKSLSFNLSQKG
jgi:hypothetical protein